jgi:predicted DNA-binding transcriptional regulator YafY
MSTGEVEDCRVSPLGLVQQGVRTYLIAKKRGSRQPVSILLARIMEAAITSGHMEYPENWNLKAFLKKGIGYPVFEQDKYGETFEFKFWVDAGTQWLKETKLSEKQITKDNQDGSYIIQVELPLTEELVRWLQSMTYYVKVIEPNFLVKRLKHDLKKTSNFYKLEI